MGKKFELLTAQGVKALSAPGRYADGQNLFLTIGKTGGKSWSLIYRHGGKTREAGLGSLARVPLKAARAKAKEGREILGRKLDPLVEWKRSETAIPIFAEAAAEYLAKKSLEWRSDKQRRAAAAMLGLPPPEGPPLRKVW
jgi:hypothetical protein